MRRLDLAILIIVISAILIMPALQPARCDCEAKAPAWKTEQPKAKVYWRTVKARITEYCPCCNCPSGHGSASGTYLTDGCAACAWLPIGTKIKVFGETYIVVDVCGTDAIDLFRDTGTCQCNMSTWTTVKIKESK